ncbi:MAG: fibronectin type III domain-containing protein, partial [Exilispira sp.]
DLNYYTSKVFKFETKSITENKTSLVIYYRIMEDFYDEDDGVIPWKQYETNAMIKGRYLQYKIIFFPSYEGRFSPQLLDFIITIIPNYPPSPPNNLQYKILNNSQVEIYWNKNIESDVIGYYLYYGTKSKFYICSDAVEGISPIFTEKNFIIITLRADTEYFVSVKAVDNAFYPQKSDFSNEIVFRTKN